MLLSTLINISFVYVFVLILNALKLHRERRGTTGPVLVQGVRRGAVSVRSRRARDGRARKFARTALPRHCT